jgi:hypothetical protein
MRTKRSIIRLPVSFSLTGIDAIQPAGDYTVEVEEELIEGLSWTAYRRVGTYVYLPALGVRSSRSEMVKIEPAEFDALISLVPQFDSAGSAAEQPK